MKKNIGNTDSIIRIVLGSVIILLGFIFQTWWGMIGLVPIATAFIGVCPAYNLVGISTKQKIQTKKLK